MKGEEGNDFNVIQVKYRYKDRISIPVVSKLWSDVRQSAYIPKIESARNCVNAKDYGVCILRFLERHDKINGKSAVRRMLL